MVVTWRCLPAWGVALALGAGLAFGPGGAAAQQPAPPAATATQLTPPAQPAQAAGQSARIRTIRQSPGLPETEVSCRGLDADQKVSVQCLVRFNAPINVSTVLAVNPANANEHWTAYFQPFDPARDDTAFYVLVETTGPRRATTVRTAAHELGVLFGKISARQQVAVAGFSTELDRRTGFTSNADTIRKAFEGIRQDGQATELYRQALAAIDALAKQPAGRRVLVIAGTGRTADTAVSSQDVVAAAKSAGVRIVTLGYVEQDADAPAIQTLERLSELTQGQSYRIRNRELPAAFTGSILTRYGAGGLLEAALPGGKLPAELDITINHPDERFSVFAAVFSGAPVADPTVTDAGGDNMTILSAGSDYAQRAIDFLSEDALRTGLIGLGAVVVLALLAYLLLRPKRRAKPQTVDYEPVTAAPPAPAPAPAPEPPAPAPVPPPVEEKFTPPPPAPVTELITPAAARAPVEAPEPPEPPRPILAYLEFNGPPNTVEIRKPYVIIGRDREKDDVIVPETYRSVSRGHVALSVNAVGHFQINNRSREKRPDNPNPIFVNGKEVEHAELADGDTVRLGGGNYGFVFRIAPPA